MFRYFGSKSSNAVEVARLAMNGFAGETAADAFGGLGTIGAVLKGNGLHVTTCDLLHMPNAFQHSRIVCQRRPSFVKLRNETGLRSADQLLVFLNTRRSKRSWFVEEFSDKRPFFTRENAERIAGAWNHIRKWNEAAVISESERKYLISSLLNGVDACANTAGTYYAYLKQWHRKALRPFEIKWIPIQLGNVAGTAHIGDALECLRGKQFDLLYLDPPYNARDYSRYYHLPESLAKLERPKTNPESLSGQPLGKLDTTPLIRRSVELDYLDQLITQIGWKRLMVQYSDGAHIPMTELRTFLRSKGRTTEHIVAALGYTTSSTIRNQQHHVFIVDHASSTTSKCARQLRRTRTVRTN